MLVHLPSQPFIYSVEIGWGQLIAIVSFFFCFFFASTRYFFLEYSTAEEAANAVKACDGYKLDKSHVFAVNLFTDFEK